MKISTIHPFPARMASEIAIAELESIPKGSTVLDPMMGSGTVLRHAIEVGHSAIGFDLDPLALLMVKVWTTPVSDTDIRLVLDVLVRAFDGVRDSDVYLPWIDEDKETSDFVDFWFAPRQRQELRKIAYILSECSARWKTSSRAPLDVMRIALSRIIVTKNGGASLARDTSHSRPHRVKDCSDFEVMEAFRSSVQQVRKRVKLIPAKAKARVSLGDARTLRRVKAGSVDLVVTSPPYLNAIDYMRGHRLSLVWMGYSLSTLRQIRSVSIGAERKACTQSDDSTCIEKAMLGTSTLSPRTRSMVKRYALDQLAVMREVARVLKPSGLAIAVVGNSCLRGDFISNSQGVVQAADLVGLELVSEKVRELPSVGRYLPTPVNMVDSLGKRMRTESVLKFAQKH